MPSYDYYCPTNGKTVEVNHRMSELLTSWGEVCERLDIEVGDTPTDSAVQRLISGGQFISSSSRSSDSLNDMPASSCCNNMGCGCR